MGKSTFGHRTYGTITMRGAATNLTVGKYCSLASGIVADGGFNHNSKFVSTFPFAVALQHVPNLKTHIEHKGDINIGNDVWIGEEVLIMSGVTIGDGAVVGIRSIITKDIPPYTIVVGANRVIRRRFTDEQIDFLIKLKWWDMPDDRVDLIAHLLSSENINELISRYQ